MAPRVVCFCPAMNIMGQTFVRCMATKGASKNIGFIGLGLMGKPMTSHLLKHGHKLHVFDISKSAVEHLRKKGATVYTNTPELASKSDYVFTMLPNNEIVEKVYKEMTAKGVNKKALYIDSSTIDPNLVRSIQKMISKKGGRFIDAPVSGGVIGAQKATLTFIVGGTKDEFKHAKGILKCMGKRITHCGKHGMGQAAKLCNNMMLGISMVGISEAMNLAIRLGLNPKTFAEIINSSTGRCWASDSYNPVPGITPTAPANNCYDGGFTVDLMTKDLGLASGVATASNTPIPLGALAHQIFRTAKSHGLGKKDFSIVYEFLKNEEHN